MEQFITHFLTRMDSVASDSICSMQVGNQSFQLSLFYVDFNVAGIKAPLSGKINN